MASSSEVILTDKPTMPGRTGLSGMHPIPRETLQNLFSSVGLTWRTLDQFPHPAGVTWFLLSRMRAGGKSHSFRNDSNMCENLR